MSDHDEEIGAWLGALTFLALAGIAMFVIFFMPDMVNGNSYFVDWTLTTFNFIMPWYGYIIMFLTTTEILFLIAVKIGWVEKDDDGTLGFWNIAFTKLCCFLGNIVLLPILIILYLLIVVIIELVKLIIANVDVTLIALGSIILTIGLLYLYIKLNQKIAIKSIENKNKKIRGKKK